MAEPYSVEKNSFQPGQPAKLFQDRFELRAPVGAYDVTLDGQHFVMFQLAGDRMTAPSGPTVVLNWIDQARQMVAAGQGESGK
jgi:hypothetical protein